MYKSWTDENGVLHVDYVGTKFFDWLTPEVVAAAAAGDRELAMRLAGI